MTRPLRVGVTQRVEVLADRGERRDALDQAWARLLEEEGLWPVPVPNSLEDPAGWARDTEIAALVLTGGNDLSSLPGARTAAPERDATERALLGLLGLPVLGVCRGLQLLVLEHGGRVSPVEGHAGTPHPVAAADGLPQQWTLGDRDAVNSYHDFGVLPGDLGPELRAAAAAPDGTVEACWHPALPRVGIMWHPERGALHPEDRRLLGALLRGELSWGTA